MDHNPNAKPIFVLVRELGERLAAYRLSRNLRQEDVAEEAGVSRGVIARIEAGKGGTIESLLRILSALDIGERSEMLVPDARVSPLDPRGKLEPRQRARPSPPDAANDEQWSWAD